MLKQVLITAESLILAFFLTVFKGDFGGCQSLIQQGVYVDARDEHGNSALMTAVSRPKSLKLARMLVKAGAAVEGTNFLGETPLISASLAGIVSAVKLLLKFGADPNLSSRSGYTPLMAATDSGNREVVQKLLEEGADPNARTRRGVTAIMRAAEWGDHAIVQTLVPAGADVNLADDNGETALMRAAAMGHKEVVSALLCAGAEPSVSNPDGWTAAMFAEDWGHPEIANMLKMGLKFHDEALSVPVAISVDHQPLVASNYLDVVGMGDPHILIEKGGTSIPDTNGCV